LRTGQGEVAGRIPFLRYTELVTWHVEILDHRVVKELDALAPDVRQLVVVHAFVKKTQKSPRTALETARTRAKEMT
jgi:phage-related protein